MSPIKDRLNGRVTGIPLNFSVQVSEFFECTLINRMKMDWEGLILVLPPLYISQEMSNRILTKRCGGVCWGMTSPGVGRTQSGWMMRVITKRMKMTTMTRWRSMFTFGIIPLSSLLKGNLQSIPKSIQIPNSLVFPARQESLNPSTKQTHHPPANLTRHSCWGLIGGYKLFYLASEIVGSGDRTCWRVCWHGVQPQGGWAVKVEDDIRWLGQLSGNSLAFGRKYMYRDLSKPNMEPEDGFLRRWKSFWTSCSDSIFVFRCAYPYHMVGCFFRNQFNFNLLEVLKSYDARFQL